MSIIRKRASYFLAFVLVIGALYVSGCLFFDEAILVRKGTIYKINTPEKVVALTFDDGPSPIWTPKILDALDRAGVKATFFMIGTHVEKYPRIAKLVKEKGHDIGNHSYDHHVLLYYTEDELNKEIKDAEKVIEAITGTAARYFRPPKAWITEKEKKQIKAMGYTIVLWTLNSKDWVTFNNKHMGTYIANHIEPGDIILFHDSGGAFGIEGGDRSETVRAIPKLVEELRNKGYRFVTITELLKMEKANAGSR